MSAALYRNTTLGLALQETLDEMIFQGSITPSLSQAILLKFDKVMSQRLGDEGNPNVTIYAQKLLGYRFADQVWTFALKNASFSEGKRLFAVLRRVSDLMIILIM